MTEIDDIYELNEQEEDHDHWKANLKDARIIFSWPRLIGCILSFSIVVGVSLWLDQVF